MAAPSRRRTQRPATGVPPGPVTASTDGTMAQSPHSQLIRDDQWNLPGVCGDLHRRDRGQGPRRAGANRPIYAAIGVTLDGERDILGLWAGQGGEGAKFWMAVLTDLKNRGVKDAFFVRRVRLRRSGAGGEH